MTTVRLSLPTVLVLLAVVGAAAFAAGQAASPEPVASFSSSPASAPAVPTETTEPQTDTPELPMESNDLLPPGHPPTTGAGGMAGSGLPVGHPLIDQSGQAVTEMAAPEVAPVVQPPLEWQIPARWQLVPNASKFRLATCRVPHAPGDTVDAELSVTRAGGSIDANAERWIGQFDAAGQKTAKRILRMVGGLQVTIVEVQGTYAGGMDKDASSGSGWALLGAIVSTQSMPQFFKLTGPAKTVSAARGEFDAMIASLVQR